jgi:hypothetical protein
MIKKDSSWPMIGLFILARLMLFLALPQEALKGYGDFRHFFNLAALPGWPYFSYWSEFPPLFSFLNALLFRISGGQEHVYIYLLVFGLTAADVGTLYTFIRLVRKMYNNEGEEIGLRSLYYLVFLVALAYGWWYFDPLAVFAMLVGIYFVLDRKNIQAGFAFGLGFLIKFFPILGIGLIWRSMTLKRAFQMAGIAIGLSATVYALLFWFSPKFTSASLISQGSKGSWETVWALIDGNYRTGLFGAEIERLEANSAGQSMGLPARIPTWLKLIGFGLIGLWGLLRSNPADDRQRTAIVGWCWCLFLLWSPGWSPQWVLYILPLILMVFPQQRAILLASVLVLVNLLEWPILLSRGLFWTLPVTVLLRTGLWFILAGLFLQIMTGKVKSETD